MKRYKYKRMEFDVWRERQIDEVLNAADRDGGEVFQVNETNNRLRGTLTVVLYCRKLR